MNPQIDASAPSAPLARSQWGSRSEKILPGHLERLASVYVRQSTPQQVLNNQESTRLQYSLRTRAEGLGWAPARVVVIDDDLGKSGATAEGRAGFQRLVAEVSLGHVGIILGVEMSRLARSCKDWYHLLEVCALFGTLIADLDGIYDPAQYNDRLLLGLKGTMSEAELHIIKQRMREGRLMKARRGELGFSLPIGYVRQSGKIALDPDEQVQAVVRLIFQKFEELGTANAVLRYLVKNKIQIGVRARTGPDKGRLEWHRPNRATLHETLHHPIYAGAYAYGRRKIDARRRKPGRPGTGSIDVGLDEWLVLLKDRVPAYISWGQFEENLARQRANRIIRDQPGAVRRGAALLTGLLRCGKCGARLQPHYHVTLGYHRYMCYHMRIQYAQPMCQGVSGAALDRFVSERALEALAPASLELSLEAAKNVERERERLATHWKQRLERAAYEAERAARQYRLVEPENRLVARTLEHDWEEKLAAHESLQEDARRFEREQPRVLTEPEREAIRQLAGDIPGLWNAPTTTYEDRKEILRQIIDRIVVDAQGESERVRVTIHWAGGTRTEHEMVRPVSRVEQLSYYAEMCAQLRQFAAEGLTSAEIAERFERLGFRPPKQAENYSRAGIQRFMRSLGIIGRYSFPRGSGNPGPNEWSVLGLAKALPLHENTVRHWIRKEYLKVRQDGRRWIIWADAAELDRLRTIRRRTA
jgi:DNA invertase Pin-like site-specific DNA recombinase